MHGKHLHKATNIFVRKENLNEKKPKVFIEISFAKLLGNCRKYKNYASFLIVLLVTTYLRH